MEAGEYHKLLLLKPLSLFLSFSPTPLSSFNRDEIEGVVLSERLAAASKEAGIESNPNAPLDYETIYKLYFDVAIPWMAKLYADTSECLARFTFFILEK